MLILKYPELWDINATSQVQIHLKTFTILFRYGACFQKEFLVIYQCVSLKVDTVFFTVFSTVCWVGAKANIPGFLMGQSHAVRFLHVEAYFDVTGNKLLLNDVQLQTV